MNWLVKFVTLACLVSTFQLESPRECSKIIARSQWGARIPSKVEYSIIPVKFVIIHHTVTPRCFLEKNCISQIKTIQNFHVEKLKFHDIGYNFLVGGEGNIYEGAGFHKVGAHTRNYNTRSLGVALIGNFRDKSPNKEQLQATKDFLECAVKLGELSPNYSLLGARQVAQTESPGLVLYKEIQKWPHFNHI